MQSRTFHTRSEEETIALGRELARSLPPGVVLLIGNLGAGKTTLAKGIVEGLNATPADEVSSPTFTLIHQYGDAAPVYHIDLYRLDEAREVESLGLDDLFAERVAGSARMGGTLPCPVAAAADGDPVARAAGRDARDRHHSCWVRIGHGRKEA